MNLITDPYLYPDPKNKPDQISLERFMLIGILLCNGKAIERAEALWKVVQDGN